MPHQSARVLLLVVNRPGKDCGSKASGGIPNAVRTRYKSLSHCLQPGDHGRVLVCVRTHTACMVEITAVRNQHLRRRPSGGHRICVLVYEMPCGWPSECAASNNQQQHYHTRVKAQ